MSTLDAFVRRELADTCTRIAGLQAESYPATQLTLAAQAARDGGRVALPGICDRIASAGGWGHGGRRVSHLRTAAEMLELLSGAGGRVYIVDPPSLEDVRALLGRDIEDVQMLAAHAAPPTTQDW